MDSLFYPLIPGILLGALAGLMPGIGVTATLGVFGLIFVTNNPMDILVLYIGILCTSQYVGSMTAISLGVPGESSSIPAVKEGYVLFRQGKGNVAIGTTALGSFFGSVLAIIIFFAILAILSKLVLLWNTHVQVIIFSLAITLACAVSDNKWYVSLIMAVIGINLGLVGINYSVDFEWLTFDQPMLYSGLPMIPVIMGIFVVPELLKAFGKTRDQNQATFYIEVKQNVKLALTNWWVILYSSVVGFFCGLVPALTTRLASNLTYVIQKSIEQKKKTYSPGNLPSLIAAETSNNAATFSVLLPLLLLGIPITPSEFVLMEFMSMSSVQVNLHFVLQNAQYLLTVFLVANVICLAIAWPFANVFLYLYKLPEWFLKIFSITLVIFPVIYSGMQNDLLTFYVGVFLFCSGIGVLCRSADTIPIVLTFLISREFIEGFVRFYQINF